MPAYPGSPADRLAWDRDGSIVTVTDTTGNMTVMGSTTKRALNSESGERSLAYGYGISKSTREIAVVFPMAIDLYAFFMAAPQDAQGGGSAHLWTVQVSKDTTNGRDGTWAYTLHPGLNPFRQVSPDYRKPENWNVVVDRPAAREIRGIRFLGSATSWTSTHYLNALHLYGTPSASATTERVAFWHPSLDVRFPSDGFDWGDVPRGTSADKVFRIKNLSSVLTTSEVDVYVEELNSISPSLAGMHSFSVDGGATFQARIALPSLAPGEITDPIIIRRVVPTDAQISTWSARVVADVYSWIGA